MIQLSQVDGLLMAGAYPAISSLVAVPGSGLMLNLTACQ